MPPRSRSSTKKVVQSSVPQIPKNAIAGFLDAENHSFFLGDASEFPYDDNLYQGFYDCITKRFYLENAPGDPAINVAYTLEKYISTNVPDPPPPLSSCNILPIDAPQSISSETKDLRFFSTHLLIGRLKTMSKSKLLKEFDIISKLVGFSYQKDLVESSIDRSQYKLFTYGPNFSCLLTLIDPVLVSSAPDSFSSPVSVLPIFSFSYKAHMRSTSTGTAYRYTLQFLPESSFTALSSSKIRSVMRGCFPSDPSTCSHYLNYFLKQVRLILQLPLDSFYLIFETRPLTVVNPNCYYVFQEVKRIYEDELFLVLRLPSSYEIPLPSLLSPESQSLFTAFGWTGVIASSLDFFADSTTLLPNLTEEMNTITIKCQRNSSLSSALSSVRDSGIDLTTLVTAFISRGSLLPHPLKSDRDSLVMIFRERDPQVVAGWSDHSSEPPRFMDLSSMDTLRVLYNNEARTYPFSLNAPRGLNFDVNNALSVNWEKMATTKKVSTAQRLATIEYHLMKIEETVSRISRRQELSTEDLSR